MVLIDEMLCKIQAGATAGAHWQAGLNLAQSGGPALYRLADFAIGNGMADADIHPAPYY